MTTVLLIRHGENEYVATGRLAGRLPEVHLNDNGKKQAQVLSKVLAQTPIKAIYSSPLERCVETAEPLAQALKLDIVPSNGLIEIDFGNWQDKTLKALRRRKLWETVQRNPSRMKFPEGETFANAQMRVVQEIEALSSLYAPKEMIACFAHSDVIRLALAFYIGTPLDLFQRIVVAPASISTVYLGEKGVQILNINQSVFFNSPIEKEK